MQKDKLFDLCIMSQHQYLFIQISAKYILPTEKNVSTLSFRLIFMCEGKGRALCVKNGIFNLNTIHCVSDCYTYINSTVKVIYDPILT